MLIDRVVRCLGAVAVAGGIAVALPASSSAAEPVGVVLPPPSILNVDPVPTDPTKAPDLVDLANPTVMCIGTHDCVIESNGTVDSVEISLLAPADQGSRLTVSDPSGMKFKVFHPEGYEATVEQQPRDVPGLRCRHRLSGSGDYLLCGNSTPQFSVRIPAGGWLGLDPEASARPRVELSASNSGSRPLVRQFADKNHPLTAVSDALPLTGPVARHQNGVADPGDLVLAYNQDSTAARTPSGPHGHGSESDFAVATKDFAGYTFLTNGAGKGQSVKNNAAYVYNYSDKPAEVYFNSYNYYGCWCGVKDDVPPFSKQNLSRTLNQNASFRWYK